MLNPQLHRWQLLALDGLLVANSTSSFSFLAVISRPAAASTTASWDPGSPGFSEPLPLPPILAPGLRMLSHLPALPHQPSSRALPSLCWPLGTSVPLVPSLHSCLGREQGARRPTSLIQPLTQQGPHLSFERRDRLPSRCPHVHRPGALARGTSAQGHGKVASKRGERTSKNDSD